MEMTMKKVLLASSALLGASAFAAGSAYAEKPVMTFSGSLAYEMIFADGDQQDAGVGHSISANDQMSELVWDAKGSTDAGLNYRANIQWRYTNGGSGSFDETWLQFSGGWGSIVLGGDDPVSDTVAGTAGHTFQAGTWGTDGNNALRNVNFLGLGTATHYYQSSAGMTGDANKISYTTPNFAGFQAGVSYTPQGAAFQQTQQVNNNSNDQVLDIAAGWGGEFGGVGLKIDGSYQWGEDNAGGTVAGFTQNATTGAITPGGAITGDQEDIGSYMLGGSVTFAGFGLGVGYFDNGDSGVTKGSNGDAGSGFNVGGSYNFGPATVSLMYQESQDDTDGNGIDDESTIYHAGVTYTIAEGLNAYGSYYNMSLDDEGGRTAATSNDAQVVIIGTRVSF
jgi:predicted porin